MIQSLFKTQIRVSIQAQSGIHAKIHSLSTIHCVFKIGESAWFTAKIHNLCDLKTYSHPPRYIPPLLT